MSLDGHIEACPGVDSTDHRLHKKQDKIIMPSDLRLFW